MVQYRSPYKNFYSDKSGSYMSIGAIVPSLVDSYSTAVGGTITGEGSGGENPAYNYRNFLYCDGEKYQIKDYPLLYEKIGNDYNLISEASANNSIRSDATGAPGTVYRTFVDNGNVFAEIHSEPIPNSTDYKRVVPNGAQLTFELLGDYPTAGGQVVQGKQYLLEYSDSFQSLASQADTHVFRILIDYDPDTGQGGTPGGTVTWVITSITLLQTADLNYPLVLPETHYGTVPALDPGTYDPLTGQGYPTGYSQYANANNDTPAFSWANLNGLPVGVTVDTYEILLEDLSTDVRTNWHVQNIPGNFTSFTVNQQLPFGVVLQQNTVEQSSIGSAPSWVNNGYSGPQMPTGEKHIYRFHVQATLSNSQQICTYQDFTAGGGALIPLYNRQPQLTENYTVTGDNSGIVDTSLNVVIGSLANQPRIKIRKAFSISDLPQVLGEFRVPDYRDRKLIGFGQGVNGAGTPLVGDRITMSVGDVGGQWFIGTNTIEDPAEFYQISDVLTTGYAQVTTLIQPYLTGEKKYTVGPVEDYIFARAPEHTHNLLHSEPDEITEANSEGVDRFTTGYGKIKGYIENFIPNLPSGETLGHSHGLLGYRPLSPKTATFGNVEGIGIKEQTNQLPDKTWDVTDPELVWTLNGTALLNWGNGVGEVGGFVSPGSGSQYLGFGSPGNTTFSSFQSTRTATFTLNCEGFSKFFALGIMGNDINGGERCNGNTDNVDVTFTGAGTAPTSAWIELMESAGTYNINNGTSGFGAYDSSYQVWKNREIEIPAIYRDAAEQPLTIQIRQRPDGGVSGSDPIGEYASSNNITGTLNNPVGAAFHPNGYDAVGIAKIGLRAGQEGTWDGCYNYKITEPGALPIVSASAQNGVIQIIFSGVHPFDIGDNVTLQNTQTSLDGTYEILAANFTTSSFQALCNETQSAGIGTVRLASGYFADVPVTPVPRVWCVDDATTIGGKEIIVTTPGTGEERFVETFDSGTANIAANAGGENITSYIIKMAGGGGGGGGSSGAGGNGFDSSVTLTVDGNSYTITAGGGQGGTAGSNGGNGGQGGTYTIPAAIFNDPRFTFSVTDNGDTGDTGGVGNGATPAGGLAPVSGWNDRGNGGNGSYDEFVSTGSATQSWFYSNGSSGSIDVNNITGVPNEEIASVVYVDFDISGGAGGNGPGNGIGGCVGYGGGTGSPGRRVTGRILNYQGTLDWVIGEQGNQGVNQQVGSVGEPAASGGSGAFGGSGGTSGSGAWGNGGSGGGGGGATALSIGGGQVIAGAGGGGGGGGSGGGWNGGGTTDPCWTGGAGLGPASGLYEASLFTFSPGLSGGSKGCTSGGGGGGGGGAGPAGAGNGGTGGNAGAGHVNTGSGSGGESGRSAISTTWVTSASSSSGSTGDGYVTLTATFEEDGENPSGGGGGGGAGLLIEIQPVQATDDITTSFFIEVGNGGSGGSGNQGEATQNGNPGRVQVSCYGRLPGDDDVVGISDPSGRYYEVPNFPDGNYDISAAGAPITGAAANIWHSSHESINVFGSVGDNFAVASNISNGMANRHIRYTGLGSRFLQIGPLNLLNADKITFGVIKGNGANGGDSPEEALDCYYKVSLDATSETVLQAVVDPQNVATSGWANYSINIDSESAARVNGAYLIIRQTRPDGSGDNPNEQGGTTNDNWGLALFGVRYATYTERIFVPTLNASIPGNEGDCGPEDGIDEIRRVVTAKDSNIRFTDGTLQLSTSTPISVAGSASVQESLSLMTKYHRSKYLIKAM